ncbi:hypothetical protein LQZ18_11770 [Lachnospiraceae bacterium ZAX-1]
MGNKNKIVSYFTTCYCRKKVAQYLKEIQNIINSGVLKELEIEETYFVDQIKKAGKDGFITQRQQEEMIEQIDTGKIKTKQAIKYS